jgi:hypothetical protein
MKGFLILIVAGGLCMSACKKSSGVAPLPVSSGLFGKWELRRQYGGLAGFDSTYKSGNGKVIQFNKDSTFRKLDGNAVVAQGTFRIQILNIPNANGIDLIYFNGNSQPINFTAVNLLTIGTTAADELASDYQKIQDQ